jgi:tetratricopeptide (TPR) repeat protein
VAAERVPELPDGQSALFRSLTADRRMLVLLDNAADVEQVRPLLPGSATCLAVVTSRSRLTSLVAVEGAHPITLDLLTYSEAHELLARHLGPERLEAEPMAVDALITGCARLPLALAIVAARAAFQRRTPLAEFVAELADAGRRLDALGAGDRATQVRAVFSWSYERLSPPAARLFRLLGLHPGPDISDAAAASLAGGPLPHTRTLLGELTRAHLIGEANPGRYAFHDLLRAYAAEQAQAHDPTADRAAAVRRVLDHYLHTGFAAAMRLHPLRPDPVDLAPMSPGSEADPPANRDAALAWFDTERPVLLGMLQTAAEAGLDDHIWKQAWTLTNFLEGRGHWEDWRVVQRAALAATERLGDLHAQARVHNGLGIAYAQLGEAEAAERHYVRALDLFRRFGDALGQARTTMNICWVLESRGDRAEALVHAERALELYGIAGRPTGQADALNGIGWLCSLNGDHERALTHCERALALQQEVGDGLGEAATWDSLGFAHHHLRHFERATDCYERSLALYREYGHLYSEADVLDHLGDALADAGDRDAARSAWHGALDLLEQIGHADADRVRAKLD